jgi:pyruvate ferredoxin oxidoreductase delta subunit
MQRRFVKAKTHREKTEALPTWEEMPVGLVEFGPPPGERNIGFTTAFSRIKRPVIDKEKCTGCLLCWLYCPDGAIEREIEVVLDYCQGCGICAKECPVKAIEMVPELKAVAQIDVEEFMGKEGPIEFGY